MRTILTAALCLCLSGCTSPDKPSAQLPQAVPADDPSILVVVHSWTGRTAVAGRTIAAMMGAKMLLARDPKSESDAAPAMNELIESLTAGNVRVLYLGFPIWDEAPSAPAQHFAATAPLAAVTVVPFYTYLHYVAPSSLDQLGAAIRKQGGTPTEALGLRIPLSFTDTQIACATRRAVLARPEVWPWTPEAARESQCTPMPHGGQCRVPAGWVWLGDTSADCLGPPPRAMQVDAFHISRTEVDIAEYQRCVEADRCPPAQTSSGISKELVESGDDSLPVPGVSFAGARAYCAWRGMRLPTEAEWMRAGRGDGTDPYPWGAGLEAQPLRGNFGERAGEGHPRYSLAPPDWPADGVRGLAPGCRYPGGTSPFGVCDLAGNLAEWVMRVDDPDGEEPVQILKGGSWLDAEPASLRLSSQARMPVAVGGFYLSGFRCARTEPRHESQ